MKAKTLLVKGRDMWPIEETGPHSRRSGQGKIKATTLRDERFLRQKLMRNIKFASTELNNEFTGVKGVKFMLQLLGKDRERLN